MLSGEVTSAILRQNEAVHFQIANLQVSECVRRCEVCVEVTAVYVCVCVYKWVWKCVCVCGLSTELVACIQVL